MNEPRFFSGSRPERCVVVDMPAEQFNALVTVKDQEKHMLVEIKVGGAISPALGKIWTREIAQKLNEFDVANATVAKFK